MCEKQASENSYFDLINQQLPEAYGGSCQRHDQYDATVPFPPTETFATSAGSGF